MDKKEFFFVTIPNGRALSDDGSFVVPLQDAIHYNSYGDASSAIDALPEGYYQIQKFFKK